MVITFAGGMKTVDTIPESSPENIRAPYESQAKAVMVALRCSAGVDFKRCVDTK